MNEGINSNNPFGNNNLNKNSFILFSLGLSIACAVAVSVFIVPAIGSALCGFVPVEFVAFFCAVGQIVGTVYYIKKHKYAYGDNYEWYQVINSSIYGIQNVLRVLLVVALINLLALPLIAILVGIYVAVYLKKIFK